MIQDNDLPADSQNPPAIAFEQWAEIAAEMLYRSSAERLEILRRRSIAPETWAPADAHWSNALAEEIAAGDLERAKIYAKRCADQTKQKSGSPKPADALANLRGTSLALDIPRGPALPFAPGAPPEIALQNAQKHAAAVQPPPPPKSAPSFGSTAAHPDMQKIARQVMPFGDTSPGSEPELDFTVERFASLCAELDMHPERAPEVLKRYGLGPDQKARLDALWRTKFSAEPATYAVFQEAKAVYAKWLASVGRGPG
ncbi:MAG: hypothetical protein HUU21_07270 [Polyangiaceae bacterium]|nr:hypothetical protein [Polyangiaceae bacterium]